jgi:hypothetical protein
MKGIEGLLGSDLCTEFVADRNLHVHRKAEEGGIFSFKGPSHKTY